MVLLERSVKAVLRLYESPRRSRCAGGGHVTAPVVLVVDDERELADMYSTWLADEYDVRTAYSGQEAIDEFDGDVDVALLDRRIPDMSGDEVLQQIRSTDSDCRVAMITAVEPDFDVLDMGFDDYLVKPVFEDDLHDVVDRLLQRATYDDQVREYFSLASKKAVLETHKSDAELASNEEYNELTEDLSELEANLESVTEEMAPDDFESAFRDI
jgi:two-component system response regulator AdeR